MKYFLHDSNAFNDEKVTELFMKFGYEGIGLFFTILEKLAGQEKPIKTEVLKKQLMVGKRLEKIWQFMEKIDIISSNNGETFNKQLLKFSEKYTIKSEKNRMRVANWREKQEDVTHYKSVRNACKDNISKDNISISKDIPKESKPKNNLIDKLEQKLLAFNGLSSLDGSRAKNRQFAYHVIGKIKKEFVARRGTEPTEEEIVASFTAIINRADSFSRKKLTSFNYVFYHFGELIKQQENKTIIV